MKGLDDFSLGVADRLFTKFPEWRKFAEIKVTDDQIKCLYLEITPPPGASVVNGLIISTENNEVTIEFDYYHGHFFDQFFGGECLAADTALDFIAQLLSEEISVISWWNSGQLLAWSTIEDGKAKLPENIVGQYSRVRIRSWNGALNDDRAIL